MEKINSSAFITDCNDGREMMESNNVTKLCYLLAGAGIGAMVGVLFAPHSGKRTRELIAEKTGESCEYIMQKGRDVRVQAADYVERGKEALADQRDHLVAAVAAGTQAYQAEAQPGKVR